ncbi:hypothetical protein [Microcystis aeruginosa]|nr:hypothetical protein [Microcystis aeruginosa]
MPPKIPPVPKGGLGLGKMAGGLRGGLLGIALMVGLALLDWWLDQPAPPPTSSDPLPPGTAPGDYLLNPLKTYSVTASANVRQIQIYSVPGLRIEAKGDWIVGATYSKTENYDTPGVIKKHEIMPASPGQFTLTNVASISSPVFEYSSGLYNPYWGYMASTTDSTGVKSPKFSVGWVILHSSNRNETTYTYEGLGVQMTITEVGSTQPIAPIPSPTPYPAPPYPLPPSGGNPSTVTKPATKPATPGNPAPLGNPNITPVPAPTLNPKNAPVLPASNPNEEQDDPPFWFIPDPIYSSPNFPQSPGYSPPDFSQLFAPLVRPYVTSDPVLTAYQKARDQAAKMSVRNPFSSPSYSTTPGTTTPVTTTPGTTTPGTTTPGTTTPGTTPPTSGTTTPTTTPGTPSNRDPAPIPLFPPFPIINPQNPQTTPPNPPPPPVQQTPPGNNCCVPTPIDNKLNDVNNKLDLITPTLQLADLALLKVINAKLGPQVNGGLSGYLQDRFSKLWNSRVIDRALNLMAVGASLHNAIMLSRDLGATLIETTGNVLAAIGIKDADGQAFDFNSIIGQTVENFVKSAVGADNYTNLKQTWIKANRILTAGANLIDSVRSMQNTIVEAQEIVGGWVAKIGNGLSRDGVVSDNTIDWMPERPDFKNPFFRAQQTIESLTEATESVNQLASAVIEAQELRTQINANYQAFQNEITVKSEEKKTAETAKKQESQSTDINKSDLKQGAPNDAD